MLSDLRDSGSLEQDADIVVFTWRPAYYNIQSSPDGSTYADGYTELIFAKHRNGSLGDVRITFTGSRQRFSNYQESPQVNNLKDYTQPLKPSNEFEQAPF